MSIEELMKPRYKVIGLWPGCGKLNVGRILDMPDKYDEKEWCAIYDLYPHLFKPLQWWEDRKPEDMPEYVKFPNERVMKVEKHYVLWHGELAFQSNIGRLFYYGLSNPATESEYLTFTQNKQIR